MKNLPNSKKLKLRTCLNGTCPEMFDSFSSDVPDLFRKVSGNVPNMFEKVSGCFLANISETFRKLSGIFPIISCRLPGNVQDFAWKGFRKCSEIVRKFSGTCHDLFWKLSRLLQETFRISPKVFRKLSGNVPEMFRKFSE